MRARRAASWTLLVALGAALALALPRAGDVLDTIGAIDPLWVAAAVALELASEASFVIVFRAFFERVPAREARALAWTSLASGALLPAGGVGGFAVTGWLARLTGATTDWIVRRSSALFFFTSGVNAAFLVAGGVALIAGAPGPHDFPRAALPVLVTVGATAAVLALRDRGRTAAWVADIAAGIGDAVAALGRPGWRLLGAVGYLAFDIAVLGVLLAAVGPPMAVSALVPAYLIGYLGNALPIPGGAGALDAGLVGALVLYGASPTQAAAAVLVYHAIVLWIPGLGGLFAYARLRPRLVNRSSSRLEQAPRSTRLTQPMVEQAA